MSREMTLPGFTHPDEDKSVVDAINNLGPYEWPETQSEVRVPTFTPAPEEHLDVRTPGATLQGPVRRTATAATADWTVLERTLAGVKRIPVDGEGIFAEAVKEHYGTAPKHAATSPRHAAPAPAPAEAQATVAEDLARYWLADIVYAAARHAEPPLGIYCPVCKWDDSGLCEACAAAEAKAGQLDALHDRILAADTFAAAALLVASSAAAAAEGVR